MHEFTQEPINGMELHALHTPYANAYEIYEKLKIIIQQLEELQYTQIGFNHWALALQGMTAALLIILIIAIVWGK